MTYDGIAREAWLKELVEQHPWNVRHALAAFSLLGVPSSLLDIGCGDGAVCETARALGCSTIGVDQLVEEPMPGYFNANLVERFVAPFPMHMVWCIETAEHLDSSAHATLCDTLTENLMEGRGNYLVFSAAYPNQGGMGHVSERPSKYWLDQFSLRELGFRKDLTVSLALLWSNIGSPLYWLASNVMVFEK